MVATLQSLYRLKSFKNSLDQLAAKDSTNENDKNKSKIDLAKSLQNVFEKMKKSSEKGDDKDKKDQDSSAECFYNKLFDMQRKYGLPGLTPNAKGLSHDCTLFFDNLQWFLFEDELNAPFSIQRESGYKESLLSILKPQSVTDFLKEPSFGGKIVETSDILAFTLPDGYSININEEVSLVDKKYRPVSIVLSNGAHVYAAVNYDSGSWFLFDSLEKNCKETTLKHINNIHNGSVIRTIFYNKI